jgi:uncharacterized UBP type Zn finger protein
MSECTHMKTVPVPEPGENTHGCEECLKIGQEWVHLRKCLICGHVGCCDQSIGKHATKHAHETGHPVIRSAEPGEDWRYCYADGTFV